MLAHEKDAHAILQLEFGPLNDRTLVYAKDQAHLMELIEKHKQNPRLQRMRVFLLSNEIKAVRIWTNDTQKGVEVPRHVRIEAVR